MKSVGQGGSRAVRRKPQVPTDIVEPWKLRTLAYQRGLLHYETIHFHSEHARVSLLCDSELEAFYLIHVDYHEFSQVHFPGPQTYPHFPVLLLLLLGFLQFSYLRNKNQVHTLMPSSVLDTREWLTKQSCCHC